MVKKEILHWLDVGIIYPIIDSSSVSPIQWVPKIGAMTTMLNQNNELIPTQTIIGCRVCMDQRKLYKAARKDHFPLPFIDQMLIDWLDKSTIVSQMVTYDLTRLLFIQKIKRRQLSHVHIEYLLLEGCPSAYAMHVEYSKCNTPNPVHA